MTGLLHQQVDAVASRAPGLPAVQYLDSVLDYGALARETNRLANVLVAEGVSHGDRVGIYMDKSIHTAVALYGIMKAGAAYVPLDPAAPVERIAGLIRDCAIRCLVTSPGRRRVLRSLFERETGVDCLIGVTSEAGLPARCLSWQEVADRGADSAPQVEVRPSDLAYIIYTSGSTGTPKGIMHSHASGLAFARWAVAEYGFTQEDRLSNHAPLHFDLSIMDYFGAAVAGAAIVIVPEEYTKLPASYSKLVEDQRITVLYTVPFALIQMLLRGSLEQRDMSALRWAIFGGEPFPPAHLRALMERLPHVRFDNLYGPAEVNGCVHHTVGRIDDDEAPIPIGKVADCADILIIDDHDAPVAAGEIGELLVCTPTMMQGYWQRDDLNALAFYTSTGAGKDVYYRTGDLVAQRDDGLLRFVGRMDRQVKVRGYRIELDEIETALTAIDVVEEAATYTVPDDEGSQIIHAQVTLRPGADATSAQVIKRLKKKLSWYAIPAKLTVEDSFPRTQTGKIDRRLLRTQALDAAGRGSAERAHSA